jgi:RimJ/RimL family protein N-acetyltransferase
MEDADAVFGIFGDAQTTAAVSWGHPSIRHTGRWIESRMRDEARGGGFTMWLLERKDDRAPVGLAGFLTPRGSVLELAYIIRADEWGHGYATEAVSAAMALARDTGRGVFATIRPANAGSIRVAEKAGLTARGSIITGTRGLMLIYRWSPDAT